ncbi:MAG: SCO6880 family protein [Acidimicrobiales bacterium]
MPEPPRYRFGPLERRGVIAGWRGGQIAVVACGLVVAVLVLRERPDVLGAVLALASVGSTVGVACWPLGGRSGEEWLPTVVRWGADGVAGRVKRSEAPGCGHCRGANGHVGTARGAAPAARGPFAGLEVLSGRRESNGSAGPDLGVVHDARAGTLTATLALRGHSFALLGSDEKQRRVSAWAGVLAALAREGSIVHRIQWLAVALPDDGHAVRAYFDDRAAKDEPSATQASYGALLDELGAQTSRHAVYLAVQVRSRRGPLSSGVALLGREIDNLCRLLSEADVVCSGPLTVSELAAVVRATGQGGPPSRLEDKLVGGGRGCPPCLVGAPWPMAVEAQWSMVRTDATWHATYWISEWPRVEVGPDFLAPVLLGPLRRSVSVVMQPVSPTKAIRAVEAARTADLADSELRRRGGFIATARRDREAELVLRRERELADGHGSFRFSGYVTVTATDPTRLEEWCEATEHAAGQARLELRRLYGDQARALLCTLPLCRGLS